MSGDRQTPAVAIAALHGWGANAQDLASLAPYLHLPDCCFFFPDAPFFHPHVPGGKMWYDLDRPDPSGLAQSRQLLIDWLQSLESQTGIPLSKTFLLGFSQGGAMTLEVGLDLPLAGLVVLSGYLHPRNVPPALPLPPIAIAHGRQDPIVPVGAARQARDYLLNLRASVQYQEFDMGHEIRPEVLTLIRAFVKNNA